MLECFNIQIFRIFNIRNFFAFSKNIFEDSSGLERMRLNWLASIIKLEAEILLSEISKNNKTNRVDNIMKTKSVMLAMMLTVTLFFAPAFAVRAQEPEVPQDVDPDVMAASIGQIFGLLSGFGASGETLGRVFEMMFMNFQNFSGTETGVKGMYMMNTSIVMEPQNESHTYTGEPDYYFTPGRYNMKGLGDDPLAKERPYMEVTREGTVEYTKVEGASITFIIWDSDGTLITALDRIIQAFKDLEAAEAEGTDEAKAKKAASVVIEAMTYFVIHINDIITGDEIILLSINGFTEYTTEFINYSETIRWRHTHKGKLNATTDLDVAYPGWRTEFEEKANQAGDTYMQWMLAQSDIANTNKSVKNTEFSLDLVQLWLKNFEIHINVEALLALLAEAQSVNDGNPPSGDPTGGVAPEDIFKGLDIEVYLLTHHFSQMILFDDYKFNGTEYTDTVGNGVPDIVRASVGEYEGDSVDVIVDAELTDYLTFVGSNFNFIDPIVEGNKITWGLETANLDFRVIPFGLKPSDVDETESPVIQMDKFEIGFSFIAEKNEKINVEDFNLEEATKPEVTMGSATVKLVTEFGKWNDTTVLAGKEKDLAVIMVSTILHVHLQMENSDFVGDTTDTALMDESNYNSETHKINVGNYKGNLPLAAIDIAGPDYEQYNRVSNEMTTHPAKTTLIPQVYASMNAQTAETYEDSSGGMNVMEGALTIEFSALIYAISYDTFASSGDRIVHDPTFALFINFESPVFWAVILVVGAVVLAGVGAFLIKKKKEEALLN
jgi:hypothetical protein